MGELSSRERLLRTIDFQTTDHLPCCFMSFTALRQRKAENMYALALGELEMGLDAMLFIPVKARPERREHPDLRGLPVHFHPEVRVEQWSDKGPGETEILRKCYSTPAGELCSSVQLSPDWPHGRHIPFVDDYQIPRAIKPLITGEEDLDALQYLLCPPLETDTAKFHAEAKAACEFVDEYGVMLAGGWGVGLDMANWLCGMQNLMIAMIDRPEFVIRLVEMIHVWNKKRMELVLSAPVDLFIRRAWYEGCDFVIPSFYRDVVLPRLKAEVDLAHDRGARFGYICSSGTRPLLDYYLEAGIDVLIGIDPVQGTHTDMPYLKQKLGERVCLWGGVSGAVTVEMGSEEEIRSAVDHAVRTLGPEGFILSPVDNITQDNPAVWRNVEVFIDEWHRHW